MPSRNPKSPRRVIRNAFFAAAAAEGRFIQNPMSRYDEMPTNSQKMKSWITLPAVTSPSIDAVNNDM